jgi:hypothetical protein
MLGMANKQKSSCMGKLLGRILDGHYIRRINAPNEDAQ